MLVARTGAVFTEAPCEAILPFVPIMTERQQKGYRATSDITVISKAYV